MNECSQNLPLARNSSLARRLPLARKLSLVPSLLVVCGLCAVGRLAAAEPSSAGLPPIETVDYDQNRAFRVNQQPFFPIVLYDAPADDQTLAELRDFGFNVLVCKPQVCGSLPAHGLYGAIHAGKKSVDLASVFVVLGVDSPAMSLKKNLLQQVADANAKAAAFAPHRPVMNAIGYWDNEPAGVVEGKLLPKEKYDDLVAAIDVAAPYLYPLPYQPAASVGDAVARARAATGGKKPVLPILQLFVWDKKDRYPSPAELRCMALLALVEGASGVGYYSYGVVSGHPGATIASVEPALWQSVKKLNQEILDVGPRLLAGKPASSLSLDKTPGGVKLKAVEDSQGLVAVVVNTTEAKREARLNCKAPGAGTLALDGGQPVPIEQGVATISLDPFGVAILRGRTAP